MIEVFKTNVESHAQSELIMQELGYHFPGSDINFDLDDCDRILRISADSVSHHKVIEILRKSGYHAELLD